VRRSGIQGRGVFATRRIRKGRRIIEYTGERISREEEERRYDDSRMSRHHTFLFKIDENTTIDASLRGSIARYINHSCDPNCEAVWEDRRIYIEAIKNIQPGVELAYDYAYEHEGRLTKELKEFYLCRCGSKKCRGTILKPRRSSSRKNRP
jgi:SET domain-containing protein